jgi:hypothetical protein
VANDDEQPEAPDPPDTPDPFQHVPDNMRSILDHIEFVPEDELSDDMNAVLAPARHGHCMTCKGELGDTTTIIVTKHGIVAAYCSGPCVQDMAVMGFLQEAYDDIVDAVKFRGGEGDGQEGS